jgi:hypothetical protein
MRRPGRPHPATLRSRGADARRRSTAPLAGALFARSLLFRRKRCPTTPARRKALVGGPTPGTGRGAPGPRWEARADAGAGVSRRPATLTNPTHPPRTRVRRG